MQISHTIEICQHRVQKNYIGEEEDCKQWKKEQRKLTKQLNTMPLEWALIILRDSDYCEVKK